MPLLGTFAILRRATLRPVHEGSLGTMTARLMDPLTARITGKKLIAPAVHLVDESPSQGCGALFTVGSGRFQSAI